MQASVMLHLNGTVLGSRMKMDVSTTWQAPSKHDSNVFVGP